MIETTEPSEPDADTERDADLSVSVAAHENFADFYAREIRNVVGLAYVLSGSRTGAEDLAADAFLAAYRHWDRIGSYDNAGAWVRRVAVNRSISTARRRVAEAKAQIRVTNERGVIPELSADNEHLWTSVRRLPRRQAQVTALHYWDGLNIREIADVLELTEATVKTHLQRARQTLADTHAKDC
jgi:RNA polymerase sigma factor (sigma-70 family)